MIEVLQLCVLLGGLYLVSCVGFMLFILLRKLDLIAELLVKLDKPTKEDIIGKLSTTEAQKEVIRVQSMLTSQYKLFSSILANDIGKVFGGKK